MQFTYKNTKYTVDAVRQTNGSFRWRFDVFPATRNGNSDLPTQDMAIEIGRKEAQAYIDSQVKA